MKRKCVFCNSELNDAKVYCQKCAETDLNQQRLYEAFHKYVNEYYLKALESALEWDNSSDGELYDHLIHYKSKMKMENDEVFFHVIVVWVKEKKTFSDRLPDGVNDENSLEYIVNMPEFRELFVHYVE